MPHKVTDAWNRNGAFTLEEAEALSDRIGIMKDGRLLALGTAESLKTQTGTEKFEEAFVAIVKGERQ